MKKNPFRMASAVVIVGSAKAASAVVNTTEKATSKVTGLKGRRQARKDENLRRIMSTV
jgi:hypothetical protein